MSFIFSRLFAFLCPKEGRLLHEVALKQYSLHIICVVEIIKYDTKINDFAQNMEMIMIIMMMMVMTNGNKIQTKSGRDHIR